MQASKRCLMRLFAQRIWFKMSALILQNRAYLLTRLMFVPQNGKAGTKVLPKTPPFVYTISFACTNNF